MIFLAGSLCGAMFILLFLVLVAWLLHHTRARPTQSTDQPPDSYVTQIHAESEQFLRELTESLTNKAKQRK